MHVFSVKIHDIKKLMDAQSFRAWVNALIIQYEESVKALEKEMEELRKQGRSTGGLDQKLTRHKNILRELRANVNFLRQGLGDAKFMVDKL